MLKALEPLKLVVEFRAGRGIAIWKIKAADKETVHRSLDVATVRVVRVAWKTSPSEKRFRVSCQNGNAVPALLTIPDRSVASLLDGLMWKFVVRRLQFLQAHDIRTIFGKPAQQDLEPAVH